MSVQGMQTRQADYQYALEGVGFAQIIIKNKKQELDDLLVALNNPEVLGGETGAEYIRKLQKSVEVVEAVILKYNAFADKVSEICQQNGAQVTGSVMDDFEAVQKRFVSISDEVSKFSGKKR